MAAYGAGLRRHLAGCRCSCRIQLSGRAAYRRQDEAHRLAPHSARRTLQPAGSGLFGHSLHAWRDNSLGLHQRSDHVADTGHIRGLCGDLHRHPQARYPPEHCDWWRIRCHAPRAGLGRNDRQCGCRGFDSVSDHLSLDAAPLLGPGLVPR